MKSPTLVWLVLGLSTLPLLAQVPAQQTQTVYFAADTKKGQAGSLTAEQLVLPTGAHVIGLQYLGAAPFSYILVIDVSNSGREEFAAEIEVSKRILSEVVRPGVDAGILVAFDSKIYATPTITTDPGSLAKALDQFRPGGGTMLYDSLIRGVEILANQTPPDRPRVLFLVSDGDDNQSRMSYSDAVAALLSERVHVYPIYLVPSYLANARGQAPPGEARLQSLAAASGAKVCDVLPSGNRYNYDQILKTLRADFSSWYRADIRFTPDRAYGFHRLEIRPRDKSITLRIPTLYLVEKQGPSTPSKQPESSPPVVK